MRCKAFVQATRVDGRPGNNNSYKVAGTPSLTVPTGQVKGLPVGATFFSGPGGESSLLRYGYALETRLAARFAPSNAFNIGEFDV